MNAGVFFAVLLAALLHAVWNAVIKLGLSKQTAMALLTVCNAAIGVVIVATSPLPAPAAWPWLCGAVCAHTAYQLFLSYAYDHGDLSRVYPIARGTAPMIVLVVTHLIMAEDMATTAFAGVIVLGAGIVLMSAGAWRESRRLLLLALGAAAATSTYTMLDGIGGRASGAPVAYVGWLMILLAGLYLPITVGLRGVAVLRADRRAWALSALGAVASFGAYAIAVWAMTKAPLALVAALRETSILFAVLIGWLWFRERMTRSKALAALLIVTGAALTRL